MLWYVKLLIARWLSVCKRCWRRANERVQDALGPWVLEASGTLFPRVLLGLASTRPKSDSLKVEWHGGAFLIQPSEGLLPRGQDSRPSGTPIILRQFSAGLVVGRGIAFPSRSEEHA
jgi:hypothetical protein